MLLEEKVNKKRAIPEDKPAVVWSEWVFSAHMCIVISNPEVNGSDTSK